MMVGYFLLHFFCCLVTEKAGIRGEDTLYECYSLLCSEAANMSMRYPVMRFGGRILYSRTAIEVDKAAKELLQNLEAGKRESGHVVLGFDIEWRPTFKRG